MGDPLRYPEDQSFRRMETNFPASPIAVSSESSLRRGLVRHRLARKKINREALGVGS